MESREAWEAENRKALEAICSTAYALARRIVAAAPEQPSPFGPYVDAVARQGVFLAILADIARVKVELAALKARLAAGYPEMPSFAPLLSVPRRKM